MKQLIARQKNSYKLILLRNEQRGKKRNLCFNFLLFCFRSLCYMYCLSRIPIGGHTVQQNNFTWKLKNNIFTVYFLLLLLLFASARKLEFCVSTSFRKMLCKQNNVKSVFVYRIMSPKWLHLSVSYWIYFYHMLSNILLKNILIRFQSEFHILLCCCFVKWKCCNSRKESATYSYIGVHGGKHLIFRTWLLHPSYLKAFSLNFK